MGYYKTIEAGLEARLIAEGQLYKPFLEEYYSSVKEKEHNDDCIVPFHSMIGIVGT